MQYKKEIMKRIKITAYEIGLVFKNGVYKRMLKEGVYWLSFGETVNRYDITKQFYAPVELNILLQDEALATELTVVDVKETEIAIHFENGLLKQVLSAGRYSFWKSAVVHEFIKADISKAEITENISAAILQHKLVTPFVRNYSIEGNEKAVLFINGKFTGVLDPGVYYWWKNAVTIHVAKADMRILQAEINGQEILTKDKAALRLNAWAQYKVADIEKALLQNKEFEKQLYVMFQLTLREYIAALTFDELLQKKDSIAGYAREKMSESAAALGIELHGFGIRDIILPGEMKDIMNQVLIAEKKAQANIIMRREETASTRSLLNTAKLMEENAILWKLKEMEYVEKIAEKIGTISVNSNGLLTDQLKQLFVTGK